MCITEHMLKVNRVRNVLRIRLSFLSLLSCSQRQVNKAGKKLINNCRCFRDVHFLRQAQMFFSVDSPSFQSLALFAVVV